MTVKPIDISAELAYAEKWAFLRNPEYADFDPLGGDCTNFISQCLKAGGAAMNFTKDTGWYYSSLNDRAAAWSGAEFFYRFIVNNDSYGPFGMQKDISSAQPGDVIQLCDEQGRAYHSLIVVNLRGGEPHVAAHTSDVYDIPLSLYRFKSCRCLEIKLYKT